MDSKLRGRPFFDPLARLKKGQFQATTIFPPDQRYIFSDTAFPWCTTGKVATGGGWGSGALVGPRHLLCASHMMTWNPAIRITERNSGANDCGTKSNN